MNLDSFILIIEQALYVLILVKVVLSYFMDPFHPIRQSIDRLVEPMLRPIRQLVPSFGRFDFSPLILLILIQIVGAILRSIL
jgi:YggT family protein